jgi:hypothetical protein
MKMNEVDWKSVLHGFLDHVIFLLTVATITGGGWLAIQLLIGWP